MSKHEFPPISGASPELIYKEGTTSLDYFLGAIVSNPRAWWFNFSRYKRTPRGSLREISTTIPMTKNEVVGGKLQEELASLNPDENLSITSEVLADGSRKHIPLMDFVIPNSAESAIKMIQEQFLKYEIFDLTGRAAIFKTSESFHFIGTKLLRAKEQIDFLGRCLLTSFMDSESYGQTNYRRIVDDRYIGHSLRRGYTALRVTANGYADLPRLVRFIG